MDGQTVLYVRDNGVGFDMAYAGKLFGAFQRLQGAHEFPARARHGGRSWGKRRLEKGRHSASLFVIWETLLCTAHEVCQRPSH